MTVLSFLSLAGQAITEQGRSISDSVDVGSNPVELLSGTSKRYIKTNKRTFTFKWEWLPSLESHTVDNRKARNYLKDLAFTTRSKILMSIKLDHNETAENIYVYINDYSEDLVRRSPQTGCDYYSVNLTVEEA
jgi:hypothetical protein